jgi:hypothetical protein
MALVISEPFIRLRKLVKVWKWNEDHNTPPPIHVTFLCHPIHNLKSILILSPKAFKTVSCAEMFKLKLCSYFLSPRVSLHLSRVMFARHEAKNTYSKLLVLYFSPLPNVDSFYTEGSCQTLASTTELHVVILKEIRLASTKFREKLSDSSGCG